MFLQYVCLNFIIIIFYFSKFQWEIISSAQLLPQQENKKEVALTYANQHGAGSIWATK